MSKTIKRKAYSYELEMAYYTGNQLTIGFNTDFLEDALQHIMALTPSEKEELKTDEWFFYLDSVALTDDKQYLYGWFKGARIGTQIPLIQQGTLQERRNPKRKNEGERMKTHFVLRMKDGLFLLESFMGNVVTPRKIEDYIQSRYKEIFESECVHHITFKQLLSPNFIEKIQEYQKVKLAGVKVLVEPGRHGQSEAVSMMQKQAEPTLATFTTLQIGTTKRKTGLSKNALVDWFRDKLSDKSQILSASIDGKLDGEDSHITLRGIEEKYSFDVQKDNLGEVLSETVFEHMLKIAKNRKRIR